MITHRACPSCDTALKTGANSCQCGWSAVPKERSEESALLRASIDHQCTWRSGNDRCRFPVNFLEPGQTKSFCRYHKRNMVGPEAFDILRQSHTMTNAEYQEKSDRETYGIKGKRSQGEQAVWESLWQNRKALAEAAE